MKLKTILNEILLLRESPEDDVAAIIDLPVDQFVKKFKDLADDPKVKAMLRAGKRDGDAQDEIVHYTIENIPCKNLIPTQSEIGQNESLTNILTDKYNQLAGILEDNYDMPPIITFHNKYIIDGHHRWSQVYVANPHATMKCLNFKQSELEPEDILKIMHLGIVADIGELPLSNADGINMLSASGKEVRHVVYNMITPNVIKIYNKFNLGNSKEQIANYIWNNVEIMQHKNRPITGAPDRNYMPQVGNAADLPKLVSRGVVNYINPDPEDAK